MVQLLFARLPQFKEDLRMTSLKKVNFKRICLNKRDNFNLLWKLTTKGSSYDSSKQKRKKTKQEPINQKYNIVATPPVVAVVRFIYQLQIEWNRLKSKTY